MIMKKLKRLLSLCLILALVLGQMPANLHTAYAADEADPPQTKAITGVTPVGTTIDLFDYWVNPDKPNDILKYYDSANATRGINQYSPLKFWYTGPEPKNHMNVWTGDRGAIFRGIVQNKLGADNYPVL